MATWSVTSQKQRPTVTSSGDLIDVVDVTFMLDSGEAGTVSIPQSQYSPETVRARVEDAAAKMAAVRDLSGTV